MQYSVIHSGNSQSFPESHALIANQNTQGDVVIVIGDEQQAGLQKITAPENKTAILIELNLECLGVYTNESRGTEGTNVLGFSRFRLGDQAPSNLIELVRQPNTSESALAAAKAVLENAGFKVAVCFDFEGRIINRLVRPYYNAALRRLDEGLATADDLDLTLRLGLGYPTGPITLLEQSGLHHHYDVSQHLFDALGEQPYVPARRARVAKLRQVKASS
jgi:3-hydroxybutyryl-CoA dehydrogenase